MTKWFFIISTILLTTFPTKSEAQTIDELTIVDYRGLAPLLHKNNDTTYVVNFWATWCGPCVKELPYFEQLNKEGASKKIKVVLVSLDFSKQYETKLIPFLKKHQLSSQVVVLNDSDSNVWIDKISPDWSGAIPATLVFKGEKREFYEQSFESVDELNAITHNFINN